MHTITFAQAINEALREEMLRDESVYFIGEDIGVYHQGRGPSGCSIDLLRQFGPERVIETPIEESAILGAATGSALYGMRPVVEIMHSEFLCHCFEHVFYGGTKGAVMTGGLAFPLVVRAPFGGLTPGQLVQDENNEGWFNNSPGLKIVCPSTPADAKGLMKSAIRDDYPVLFMEHKGLYKTIGPVPDDEVQIPLGKAAVCREGRHISVLTYGRMVHIALQAAEQLETEGVELEIVDLRSLHPLDEQTILASVEKTGRAVVFHEARKTGGLGGEVAATIAEKGFGALVAPVLRVAAPDVPANVPCTQDDLIAGVKRLLDYSPAGKGEQAWNMRSRT
ncbi:MAG: alpha-ketoacid dehydrogenase subunit beta [Oscillospiraceae bacterium]|nr:alpha-ketoacid dehydrogenase subunit beta [Oscillospiraceae bacterium]